MIGMVASKRINAMFISILFNGGGGGDGDGTFLHVVEEEEKEEEGISA